MKKIKLKALILVNISALFGIRWIAKSTSDSFGLGVAAIPMWFIFALLFFVPQALICAELSSAYPSDSGMYVWVKAAFGEKWGFMVSWLNWTSKLFWYASFMTFFTVNIAYMIGKPEILENKYLTVAIAVIVFVTLSILSINGLARVKFLTGLGAFGSMIPAVILIILAAVTVGFIGEQPASAYTIQTLAPKMNGNTLVAISAIIFGYTGGEVVANFVTEIEDPRRNYPKAILLSAVLVGVIYVIGSVAITSLMPTSEIKASTGILDAISIGAQNVGIGSWLVRIVALGISVSILGATVIYIASPIKMLFGSVPGGMFGKKLTEMNEVGIPKKAVYLQTVIVSLLLIAASMFPGVDAIYNILVTMTALTALFPYVILILAYIRIKKKDIIKDPVYVFSENKNVCMNIARVVLLLCIAGILFTCAPIMGSFRMNLIYEIEMIGGGLLVMLSGLWLWNRYEKRTASLEGPGQGGTNNRNGSMGDRI